MEALDALMTRCSIGGLIEPAPDEASLQRALEAALRAPDHRLLRPWRFLTIRGEGRLRLGEVFLEAGLLDNPNLGDTERQRLLAMPLRAPLLVVAVMSPKADDKVPAIEQVLSAGAAVQNLLLALHAQGFAAMWRTGWMAEHQAVRQSLGLAAGEGIAGFVYVGTAASPARMPVRLPLADYVRTWPSA